MSLLKKIQQWWRGLRRKPALDEIPPGKHAQQDLGVSVVRIRLPSGDEIIIVEVHDDE